jgi:hypothetical protein
MDSAGLPIQAFAEGTTFLFANWTPGAVDVAEVRTDGSVEIHRALAVSTELPAVSRAVSAAEGGDLAGTLRVAGIGLSTASCALSVVFPPALLSCSAAIFEIVVALSPGDNAALEATATAFSAFASGVGCSSGDPFACGAFVVNGAAAVVDAAERDMTAVQDEIRLAHGTLVGGDGDVQITLTWNNTADLDLHVTDPFGERIYFAHPTSQSGGRLDFDDTNGLGPENVFWPSGQAPAGTYVVEVDHFSGASPSYYDVLVRQSGFSKTYSGSLATNQMARVVTFQLRSPLPAVMAATRAPTRRPPGLAGTKDAP